jgi:hypothetical protein
MVSARHHHKVSPTSGWKAVLVALVRRRTPRGVWLYTVCAILVVLYALSVPYGIGAETAPGGPRLSDFVIPALWLSLPVAIVLSQLRRQTLLGWFLLFAGFTLVAVGLGYGMLEEQLFDAWPLTLLAIAIGICVGLVLHRPAVRIDLGSPLQPGWRRTCADRRVTDSRVLCASRREL